MKNKDDLIKEIQELKKSRNAVILAHNYERGEVQDIADYTGDSLELARIAANVTEEVIIFCGVYFMAETAAILNPGKTVLIPAPEAGCPMADMINGEQLRAFKAKHPDAITVCYVNSTAEVKAECDICVTSGNAEKVMAQYPADKEVIFVPDQHLGTHIANKFGVSYNLWPGYCPIHAKLLKEAIEEARKEHPNAIVMVHPECPQAIRDSADQVLSTGGMCAFVKSSPNEEFIIGTEIGILHRLEKENPGKKFYPASAELVCKDMKFTTLERVAESLRTMTTIVTVPEEISKRAKHAIDAMLAIK